MIEENFEILLSETLQIDSILLLDDNNYFTKVEENFEIWLSETLQIDSILLLADNHYFTIVEELFLYCCTMPFSFNMVL